MRVWAGLLGCKARSGLAVVTEEGLRVCHFAQGPRAGTRAGFSKVVGGGVGDGTESGDRFGMGGGDVDGFAGVGLEIVKLTLREMEFPRLVAHGFEHEAFEIEKTFMRRGGSGFSG